MTGRVVGFVAASSPGDRFGTAIPPVTLSAEDAANLLEMYGSAHPGAVVEVVTNARFTLSADERGDLVEMVSGLVIREAS